MLYDPDSLEPIDIDSKNTPKLDLTQPFEFLGFAKPPGGVVIDDEDVWTGPGLPGEPLDQTPKFDPTQPFEFLGFAKPRLKPAPIQDLSSEAPPSSFDDASQTVPPPQSPAAPVSGNSFANFELEPLPPAELERMARRYGPLKGQPRLSGGDIPPSPPPDVNRPDQPPSFRAVPGPAPDPNTPKYREPNEKIIPGFWSDGTPDNGALPNNPAPEVTSPIPPSASNEAPPKDAAPPAQAPKPAPVQPAPAPNGGPRIQAPQPEPEPEQTDWPEHADGLPETGILPEIPEAPNTPSQSNSPGSAVRDFGSRAGLAAASGLGDALSGLARAWDMLQNLDNPQGSAQRSDRLGESALYQLGQQIKQDAQEFYQPDPRLDHTLAAKIASTIGSMDAAIATSVLGPEAALATGAAQGGESAAEEASAFGHPDKADQAFLLNAGLQLFLPKIPISKGFSQVLKQAQKMGISPEAFGRLVRSELGRKMLGVAGRGAALGGINQAGQNAIAKGLGYDPERPLLQGVGESMLLGAGTDAAIEAAHLSDKRNASRRVKQAQAQVNEEPPQHPDSVQRRGSGPEEHLRYSQGEGRGMPVEQLHKTVDQIKARWTNAPKINVVNNPHWTEVYTGKPVQGTFNKITGEVTLNAAFLDGEIHARQVLAEEVVGHFGLQQVLGPDMNKVLDRIGRGIPDHQLQKIADDYKLRLSDQSQRRQAVEEYIAKRAQADAPGRERWKIFVDDVQRILGRIFGYVPAEAEIRRLMDKNREFLTGDKMLRTDPVVHLWTEAAKDSKVFQYERDLSHLKTPEELAAVIGIGRGDIHVERTPESEKTGAFIIRIKDAPVYIEPAGDYDSSGTLVRRKDKDAQIWAIASPLADSQGKEKGGGTVHYQVALAWAHNNGKIMAPEAGKLSDVNRLRRTSNMLSSALRFGTTTHMLPQREQQGLHDWRIERTPADFYHNISLMANEESKRTLEAFPDLKRFRYEFKDGTFRDRANNVVSIKHIDGLVHSQDPKHEQGVGRTTAIRAIMTTSIRSAKAKGESMGITVGQSGFDEVLYSLGE